MNYGLYDESDDEFTPPPIANDPTKSIVLFAWLIILVVSIYAIVAGL